MGGTSEPDDTAKVELCRGDGPRPRRPSQSAGRVDWEFESDRETSGDAGRLRKVTTSVVGGCSEIVQTPTPSSRYSPSTGITDSRRDRPRTVRMTESRQDAFCCRTFSITPAST